MGPDMMVTVSDFYLLQLCTFTQVHVRFIAQRSCFVGSPDLCQVSFQLVTFSCMTTPGFFVSVVSQIKKLQEIETYIHYSLKDELNN